MSHAEWPTVDAEVADWVADVVGPDGAVDIHTHFMPDSIQRAVWRFFDVLDNPAWPITYRGSSQDRLDTLASLGVTAHTALAYAHKPGMVGWLNDHTLALAEREPAVIPTFTIFPEEGIAERVRDDLGRVAAIGARGGAPGPVVKVHLQVGRFSPTDPRLDEVWPQLIAADALVLIHSGAVYGVDGGEDWCGIAPVARLLDAHPDLRICLAHLGFPDGADTAALLHAAPNVVADVAMIPTDPQYQAMQHRDLQVVLDRFAEVPDQILFGSDFPSIPNPFVAQVRGLARFAWGRTELAAVLRGNQVRARGG